MAPRKRKETELPEYAPAELVDDGADALLEQLRSVQRPLQAAPDLDGAGSREELQERLRPAERGSSKDRDQMEAMAEALVLHSMDAHEKNEQPSIRAALEEMGVPVEVYAQMARDPEFHRCVKVASTNMIATPRYIGIMLAMTQKAQSGDVQAVKALGGIIQEMDDEAERLYQAYQTEGGRERFLIEVRSVIKELEQLEAGFAQSEIPQDVVDEQRKRIHTVVGAQQRYEVDHGDLLSQVRKELEED